MHKRLIIALALAACVAVPVSAQVPAGFTPQLPDQRKLENNHDISAKRYDDGVAALQAKNFAVAEGIFADVLRANANHSEANFFMGVAKMSLGKWADAKPYLEIAAKKKPKDPDPKSRLGVVLAKLGDKDGAKAQRDALVKMQKACQAGCRNADFISNGIAMIDNAAS